jgi:hypothetical protein
MKLTRPATAMLAAAFAMKGRAKVPIDTALNDAQITVRRLMLFMSVFLPCPTGRSNTGSFAASLPAPGPVWQGR